MYNIEILQSASDNIDDIGRYIAKNLQNKPAAERLTEKIYSSIETLAAFPYAHAVHLTPPGGNPLKHEYRKIAVDNYYVFYHVDEKRQLVTVAAVSYARRNIVDQIKLTDAQSKDWNAHKNQKRREDVQTTPPRLFFFAASYYAFKL